MVPSLPCRNLPVVTQSGVLLGRIVDVEVDEAAREVRFYHVAPPFTLSNLWQRRLLIAPDQVVSLTHRMMIVEDLKSKPEVTVTPGLASESS
jgi:uncharacterized protein YrrD